MSIGKGGVGSIEENTEEAEKELTDPFDELQAFFAGGSPAGARSSDGNNPNAIKVGRLLIPYTTSSSPCRIYAIVYSYFCYAWDFKFKKN